jgi:hypothetical protein
MPVAPQLAVWHAMAGQSFVVSHFTLTHAPFWHWPGESSLPNMHALPLATLVKTQMPLELQVPVVQALLVLHSAELVHATTGASVAASGLSFGSPLVLRPQPPKSANTALSRQPKAANEKPKAGSA